MPAIDGDGSSPGNVVRYEMVGRGKALKYFQVDPDTGAIRIRDELRKEEDTEYQVDIRAYDMGEPQLSPGHFASIRLAFSDDSYTTGVPETTGINATIKLIQSQRSQGYLYAVVTPEMDIDTPILQVRATDRDSKFGMIRYKIFDEEDNNVNNDNLPTSYFVMTEDTGILRTAKSFRENAHFPLIFWRLVTTMAKKWVHIVHVPALLLIK
ncbi:Cadherin-99C [Eumeta japonica]|uniref:Cadherin-99C n=1 Tax=Eumeta variegata TaxID=151549 RepID=A0A4C1TMM4_EUMVA|nr:Cadherin-99C [Eumeta japonica]